MTQHTENHDGVTLHVVTVTDMPRRLADLRRAWGPRTGTDLYLAECRRRRPAAHVARLIRDGVA